MNKKIKGLLLTGILIINNTSLLAQESNEGNNHPLIVQEERIDNVQTSTTDKEVLQESTDYTQESESQEQTIDPTEESESQGQTVDATVEDALQEEGIQVIKESEVVAENKVILTLNSKKVVLYGQETELATPPKVVKGRTYLPLRFVGEELLHATVEWKGQTKQILVRNNEVEVQLTAGSNKALVNGREITLDSPPLIEKGSTLLPLRFMTEQFGLKIQYLEQEKRIEIQKPLLEDQESDNNIAPTANFDFADESYTEGQEVRVIDLSSDADGDYIAEKLWQINNDPNKTASSLEQLFNRPKAGNYEIALKVRDSKGKWSEWTSKSITILPNRAPEITKLITVKDGYAQGEPIEIEYAYDNESWENIKAERWTYRATTDPENNTLFIKPKYIFAPGEYIVTLELQDENGNWSTKEESRIHITDKVMMTEFEYKFTNGSIGDTIDNFKGTNYQSYKEIEAKEISDVAGTLLMSDSPEVVTKKGILYRDTVKGTGRVLIHHINDFSEGGKKRLVVVAKNNSKIPAIGTISQLTVKGPSSDILHVGQQVLYDYFNSTASQTLSLKAGEYKVIYDSKNRNWQRGDAISGMFNFDITGDVTFTIAAIDEKDKIEDIDLMEMPERDVHPRGTFNVINKNYTVDLSDETESTKLVLGKGSEEWVMGTDALTGEVTANKGNFGIEYHIQITAKEDTAIILNPRGNMFKGAIKWKNDKAYMTPNKGYFPSSNRATFLGTLKAGETKELIYILPNGSSAPVLFGFIPKSEWNKQ